jgi:hypothetical protein
MRSKEHGVRAVAVTLRKGWPATQLSPGKSPALRIAIFALLRHDGELHSAFPNEEEGI